jgi:simple sugar transport system substrate-binding protein
MKLLITSAVALIAMAGTAMAQSGTIGKAVGGYSFETAAKEAPETKNFHSNDGVLTFAIVTHTAGNGFFDPVYVGATVAGNMVGAKVLLLGSESPTDDPAREIEILNQIINDPKIDGIIMTTPQVGAYNDIVRAARAKHIPIATTNSYDPTLLDRNSISHTGQDASAAAIAGEALVKCLIDRGVKSGTIILPNDTAMGNIEVNNRVTAAFQAIVKGLKEHGMLADFQVDAGPENVGVSANMNDPTNSITGKMCAYGFDLGPAQQEALRAGNLTGALGQQPFLQGFWPVMQLYLEIDRGISAANLDTRAQLVTGETVGKVGSRYEN